jgi:hypothetical protein
LFGEHNGNLHKIAGALEVRVNARGNTVFIQGRRLPPVWPKTCCISYTDSWRPTFPFTPMMWTMPSTC